MGRMMSVPTSNGVLVIYSAMIEEPVNLSGTAEKSRFGQFVEGLSGRAHRFPVCIVEDVQHCDVFDRDAQRPVRERVLEPSTIAKAEAKRVSMAL